MAKIYIQPKLSTTQQSAVDSGIDSAKVAQIATNSTNITTLQNDVAEIETKVVDTYTKEETDVKLDTKISLLGNEAVSGEPYHIPYHIADLRFDTTDSKLKANLMTITVDNNKTLTTYPLEVEIPTGTGGVTKEYVDTAVSTEKTRAEGAEEALETYCDNLDATKADQSDLANKVDRSVKDDQNAINTIDNQKGQNGAVMQTQLADTNGTIVSFNTASENGADGILAQVYAKNTTGTDAGKGMRLNFTKTGAYYGVGTSTPIDTDHELAVKKDVSDEAIARYNADQATDSKVQVLENTLDHKLSLFKFEKAPGTDQPVRMTYYFDKVTDADKATITAYTLQMNNTTQSTPETFTMDVESATTTTAGLESAADKTKLDSLSAVSGTNDGTNWTTITIGDTTKNIPTGGGGGGVEVINLSVKPTSSSASTGTITAEQWNKLKAGLNPIHLTVYGDAAGTVVAYYVDINQYWYNALRNEIGSNVILNVGHASSSTQIANLQIREITETTPYTYDLTLTTEDFIYSEWIKSSEIDGKTIVKNSSTNKYETAIGGYMGEGLVPYEPYICWELALNQWATNPKVWFVTDQEYVMQVGDTVTAIILDQDTGNKWTISNATVATYTIDGVEHVGVQYVEPKSGSKELYVLRWDIEGEEKVVVYNNDGKVELHNGAILTAYKMVTGSVPVMLDGKFIGIDGTTITYDATTNKLSSVQGVTREEFKFLEGVVENKQDLITKDNKVPYEYISDTPDLSVYALKTEIPSSTDFVKTSGDQTVGGEKSFTDGINVEKIYSTSNKLVLRGCPEEEAGGGLMLYQRNHPNFAGQVMLQATTITASSGLTLTPDGHLYLDEKEIIPGGGYNIGTGLSLDTATNTLSNSAIVECYNYQQEGHDNLWSVKDKNGKIFTIKDIPDPYERARIIDYDSFTDPYTMHKEFGEIVGSEKEVWIETASESGKYKIYQRSSTEVSTTECQFYRCFIDGSSFKVEFVKFTDNEAASSATWTVTTKTLS